ncbi:sensor histidine kinase [Paenibacillus alkalitolerans]|uniref:sensor histidine kinase n=1 Tax=Paenibacillus alkalitolerans TaxID=2799335 RepID=UPI0018F2F4AD|nr:sensor histidine kinase [Paenibacillus alkalitolerans]
MQTFRLTVILVLICGIVLAILSIGPNTPNTEVSEIRITDWNIQWIKGPEPINQIPPSNGSWHSATVNEPLTTIPDGVTGAWVHIIVPPTSRLMHPGLYIERLYGLDITVYEDSEAIFRSSHDYDFERNIVLIPLTAKPVSSDIYIRIESKERAGISSAIQIGEFDGLSSLNVRKELPSLLLGAGIAFLGIMMLVCSGFFLWKQRRLATSLSLFVLSTGTLIAAYSSMPYFYFPEYGHQLLFLFDTSMFVLFPSLFYFVIHIFEETYLLLKKFAIWLSWYYTLSFLVMFAYQWIGEPFYFYYRLISFWIPGPLILLQLLITIVLAFRNAYRGNRNSIILSTGLIGLALSGVADLIIFYTSNRPYVLFLWKFGIVFLIVCLVMILSRRISADYSKLLSYSKELELYNHQLQRTERMKIISDLAASIAHEVRNPLQVTRGFLQLLSRNANEERKSLYSMAISELDRAAAIISDFLTFAKPEQETVVAMDVKQELCNIETIMRPLAAMHGGTLNVNVPDHLTIFGNPSKFKQAFINMIKNSIESFQDNGKIEIEAFAEKSTIVIRISDNGQGMDEEQIVKLGEPYFSTKTKGTGLGLMVTFRIIEVMKGTLEFRSMKGKGTEAIVRFPLIHQD